MGLDVTRRNVMRRRRGGGLRWRGAAWMTRDKAGLVSTGVPPITGVQANLLSFLQFSDNFPAAPNGHGGFYLLAKLMSLSI